MKRCDYCGRESDDTVTQCRDCGSSDFADDAGQKLLTELRLPDPDEVPLTPLEKRDGNIVILKCRTPGEAYLVRYELEKGDIIALLPGHEDLLADRKRKGYVEVRVSSGAYESATDLRKAVEFQYRRLRRDQPLSNAGKAVAIGCAIMIVPGLLVFLWLLSNYRTNGYHRRAKEFKLLFLIGLASWPLLICGRAIFV
jgi:hypothetical protein